MVLDKPWEGKYTTFFCPVYAQGKWHLYYVTELGAQIKFICYAQSDDGQNWTRPNLGIVESMDASTGTVIFRK